MKKLIQTLLMAFLSLVVKSQTTFDESDIVANQQKVYTIQIDMANGNIVMPIKKKIFKDTSKLKLPTSNEFIVGRKYRLLYKDTFENNTFSRKVIDTAFYNSVEESKAKKYVVGKRFFTPKVGDFIKLIFINVPKHEDVNASVNFTNKNQEGASTLNNILAKYQGALDKAVDKDSARINKENTSIVNTKEIDKIVEPKLKSIESAETVIDKNLKLIELNLEKSDKLISKPISVSGKNGDPGHKIEVAKQLKNSISKLLNDSTLNSMTDSVGKSTILNAKTKLDNLNHFLDASLEIIDSQKVNYNNIKIAFENYKKALNDLKNGITEKYKKQVDSVVKIAYIKDSVLQRVKDSIYSNRTIQVIPFQVDNADMSVISLNFLRDGKMYAEREIVLKNNHGFKMDFSTGFVAATLKDDNYRLYKINNDSAAILEDSKGKFAIGFGFFTHAYFRTGSRINFALTSGFALNGSNQTVNYLLGLSVPLGLEERFVISAGAIFGKVKQLSEGYTTSPSLDNLADPAKRNGLDNHWYTGITNTGVPLTEKWRTGFYAGISYNLGSLIGGNKNKTFKVN